MRWLDGITDAMDMNLGKLWEMERNRGPLHSMGLQRVGHNWVTEQQQTLITHPLPFFLKRNKGPHL